MTPTQLRAFAAVARLGAVKQAAAELKVSEAAISLHIGQLRKELGDQLFVRTAGGIAFTPGGLRLASRATEMLGLQDRTILEVSQAGSGRRLLRVAASSMFAEHSAPGLIESFAGRADDLDVELSVHQPRDFAQLLHSRAVDVAVGPQPPDLPADISCKSVLNYGVVAVAGPDHHLTRIAPSLGELQQHTWLLGPSITSDPGLVATLIRRLNVPESRQRIFQSHAAALEEAKRGNGIAIALASAVSRDLAHGALKRVHAPHTNAHGVWSILTLSPREATAAAAEFVRFAATPRAIQAMRRGAGVTAGR
ncbi:MAG TPA: LysR family transcriptional regulator, partial [Jatrophihabitans sp.]|nr:LysR family transcriptional regulator [Jatrophihabitans sp.]